MRHYVPDYRLEELEPSPVLTCDNCDEGIYEDELYYRIEVWTICKKCMRDFEEIA